VLAAKSRKRCAIVREKLDVQATVQRLAGISFQDEEEEDSAVAYSGTEVDCTNRHQDPK
jgi:hypothetical protein